MSDLFRGGIPQDFAFFEGFDLPELLRATAWRTSALKADSSTSSPSWMSIARRTFPSRLVRVCFLDELAHSAEGFPAPVPEFGDSFRDELRCRRALARARLFHVLILEVPDIFHLQDSGG